MGPLSEEDFKLLPLESLVRWKTNIVPSNILKNVGAEFKEIDRKDQIFWYQLYRGELFHLMTRNMVNPFMYGIKVTKDMCID